MTARISSVDVHIDTADDVREVRKESGGSALILGGLWIHGPREPQDAVAAWQAIIDAATTCRDRAIPPLHELAVLVGGTIPAHEPGAFPSLSCCGGSIQLTPAANEA